MGHTGTDGERRVGPFGGGEAGVAQTSWLMCPPVTTFCVGRSLQRRRREPNARQVDTMRRSAENPTLSID
jgi:hypothetical protein